jgi:hypothetical protein
MLIVSRPAAMASPVSCGAPSAERLEALSAEAPAAQGGQVEKLAADPPVQVVINNTDPARLRRIAQSSRKHGPPESRFCGELRLLKVS